MNPLPSLAEFGAWLLHNSCQTSVVIGLVLLAQWLFQKWLSPAWRYRLWLLVVIRLMLPISPESAFSIFNYTDTVKALALGKATDANSTTSSMSTPHTAPEQRASVRPNPDAARAGSATTPIASTASQAPPMAPDISRGSAPRSRPAAPLNFPRATLGRLGASLSLLWLIGVLVLLSGVILFPLRLNALLAKHETAAAPGVFEILDQAKRLMAISRVLPIVQSRAVESPALMGFIRPWLLLPEGMAGRFTPEELKFVLLHELAHLKRRDIATNWVMTVLQILHWFNPLVWLAFSRMRADRELACDELVLSSASDAERKSYGQAIIKLLEGFARPAGVPTLVGILEDKKQMKRRMAMIARFDTYPKWSALAPVLAITIGLATLTEAQSRIEQNKSGTPGTTPSITLRQLPTFASDLYDISKDGRYGLGNVKVGEKATVTVPFVVDLNTGVERRFDVKFPGPGTPVGWRFSPDARQILCLRLWEKGSNYSKEILVLDIESGQLRRVYRNENVDTIWLQDWSSDGETILVNFERRDEMKIRRKTLALISVKDGTAQEIKTSPNLVLGNHFSARLSPDMRTVAFWAAPAGGGTGDVRLISIDGSGETVLVEDPAREILIAWTASPNRIVFMSDRRRSWDAYAVEIRDGHPIEEPVLWRELGSGVSPLRLTTSGDFFFEKTTRDVDVYFAEFDQVSGRLSGKPRRAPHIEGRSQFPAWSADGRNLAYVKSDSQDGVIGIRDMESGAVRELDFLTPSFSFPHWSNDGKSIHALSYSSGQALAYRIDLDAKQATIITKGRSLWYDAWPLWSWALDGKSFYQWRSTNTFARVDLETGSEMEFQIAGGNGAYSCALSPDCKQLLRSVSTKSATGEITRTISIVPVSGGEPRELVQLVGPEAIEAIQARQYSDQGLGWSPDGRYVLFVKGSRIDQKMHSLWRVPVAGGEAESLGVEMEKLRQPAVAPGSRHIAFTAGGTKTELWVMENFLPAKKVAAK